MTVASKTAIVTVISAFYNREHTVAQSLESLESQTLKQIDCRIFDDGSTDGTLAALQKFASSPRMTIISQRNRGFVGTMRQACAEAKTPYIAVHASGDLSVPDRLEKQVHYMEAHPECVLLGGHVQYRDANGTRVGKVDRGRLRGKRLYESGSPIDHSTFLFRRDVYERVGGYRTVFQYAQDFDLLLRMRREGQVDCLSDVLVESVAFLQANGIRRSPRARILQKYYVDLAIQCDQAVSRGRPDPVELWGANAAFLRSRSGFLWRRFLRSGLSHLHRRRYQEAIDSLECSLREGNVAGRAVSRLAIAISRVARRFAQS